MLLSPHQTASKIPQQAHIHTHDNPSRYEFPFSPSASVPLVTGLVILARRFDKLLTLMVHTVVGQMHEPVAGVLGSLLVFVCAESHQPLVVDVHSQRVEGGDDHVNTQVEFEFVDEKRVADISITTRRRRASEIVVSFPSHDRDIDADIHTYGQRDKHSHDLQTVIKQEHTNTEG